MEPLIGEIRIFPYDYEPDGWLRCEGQKVAIRSYAKLFSLLGTRYGGDGRQDFELPKMPQLPTARSGMSLCYFIATDGAYPVRPPRSEGESESRPEGEGQ